MDGVMSFDDAIASFLADPVAIAKTVMINDAAHKAESPLEDMFWHFMRKVDPDAWDYVEIGRAHV